MTAWNGNDGYTFDRVERGTVHIEHACISLLGGTQPGVLSEYVRDVHKAKTGGDGFIQRFSMTAWPDIKPEWEHVDERADSEARENAWNAFDRLNELTQTSAKAGTDRYDDLPYLHFDGRAQGIFNDWLGALEKLLRGGELAPERNSHFSKYRKLVPALALLNHLASGGDGPTSKVTPGASTRPVPRSRSRPAKQSSPESARGTSWMGSARGKFIGLSGQACRISTMLKKASICFAISVGSRKRRANLAQQVAAQPRFIGSTRNL